jgi:hypothetical protein
MGLFLSYSRGDAQQADEWVEGLERFGHRVWIDRAGIRGGEQWKATIVRAIEEADALVLLLSPSSARSDNVRREIDLAVAAKKLIVPIEIAPPRASSSIRPSASTRRPSTAPSRSTTTAGSKATSSASC